VVANFGAECGRYRQENGGAIRQAMFAPGLFTTFSFLMQIRRAISVTGPSALFPGSGAPAPASVSQTGPKPIRLRAAIPGSASAF